MRALYKDDFVTAPPGKADVPLVRFEPLLRMMTHGLEATCGTVAAATGAAMDIATPFDPAVVIVINVTDGSVHFKTPTMIGDDSMEMKADVANNAADGITLGTKKFTIGVSGNLNALNDVLHWIALAAPDADGSS